jgi:hypothetical protein
LSAELAKVPDEIDLRNPAAEYHRTYETVDVIPTVHSTPVFQR